ncbi:MAG: hypothetical protein LDL33_01345, partial [Desulfomonile sp.]|nr:hypothetical protein [Desulfomonile sp.]
RFLSLIDEMRSEGDRILSLEGIPAERRVYRYSLDLRYVRQYHEVNVPVTMEDLKAFNDGAMRESFHIRHDRLYGYSLREEGAEVELVNLRFTAIGVTEKPVLKREVYKGKDPDDCLKGTRPVFIPSYRDFKEIPVYNGDIMGYGQGRKGPTIIEKANTTIFVPPEYEVECDAYGSYLLTLV